MNSTIEDLLGSRARVKILKALTIHEELTITLLIKKTRLNHTNVRKHLDYLKTVGLVEEKAFGRIKIFRYKLENMKARAFKNLIELWEDM